MGLTGPVAQMIGMLGAGIGGPVLASMFAPEGQELQSFQDVPGLRPTEFLGRTRDVMSELGQLLSDRAGQPVSLPSAYVQTPPAYTGGTLPMPVGVNAQDPAFLDRSMLTRPGLDTSELSKLFGDMRLTAPGAAGDFSPQPGTVDADQGYHGTPDGYPDDDRIAVPKRGGQAPVGAGTPQQETPAAARAGELPADFNAMLDGIMPADPTPTQRTAVALDADGLDEAATPNPSDDFDVDSLFASAADNSGDDFDKGMANIQMLMAALSRGDVDINSILGAGA